MHVNKYSSIFCATVSVSGTVERATWQPYYQMQWCYVSGEINWIEIYEECVVKAELYVKYDNCCPQNLVCGVVVTLRNDSRWLIHDSLCDDLQCQPDVFDASCMSSDWILLAEKKITVSGVGDYMQAGFIACANMGNMTDCSESCRRMINLP